MGVAGGGGVRRLSLVVTGGWPEMVVVIGCQLVSMVMNRVDGSQVWSLIVVMVV